MKIVHLCTQDNGGAGVAAYRLNLGLIKAGYDSKLIVLNKTRADKNVYAIPDNYETNKKLINDKVIISKEYQNLWGDSQQKILAEYPEHSSNYEIFTLPFWNIELSEIPEIAEADIINLHWVVGMLSDTEKTKQLFARKKIVWTLHDMNPFTGGCHYSAVCENFKKNCGSCPQLVSNNPHDLSFEIFNIKKDFYDGLQINIVTPSKWLSEEAKRSSLFSKFPINVIPYGFPANQFLPYPSEIVKEKLNIPKGAKLILAGAAYGNERKGFKYLIEALQMIEGDEKVYLGIFGNVNEIKELNKNYEILSFGIIDDEKLLAMLYSAADVFVIPSLQDNLPNVVPEAMLCGTPVVGFNIGGIPDMIEHKVNGYLAQPFIAEDLASGIVWILNNFNKKLREKTYQLAANKYSLEKQAQNYIDLYERILNRKNEKPKNFNIFDKEILFPKITVVTPSFNHGQYIEETINSVLEQNYPNLEYIIMDGGSTDNTVEIIKKYEKYLTYWQSKPDGGQYYAITEGFKRSTGEIMTWINSDDLLAPLSLPTVASIFNRYENVEWIMGRGCVLNFETGNFGISELHFWDRKKYLTETYQFIQQEGSFWRRSLYEKAGGYVSTEYSLASDLELWVRFFRYAKLFSVDTPLGIFRFHEHQKSKDFRNKYLEEAEIIIEKERERVKELNEKLDSSNNKIETQKINFLKYQNNISASLKLDEIKNALINKLPISKLFDKKEIYSLFYYYPENELLYQAIIDYYKEIDNENYANLLLWRSAVQFQNPYFLARLITSELALNRITSANFLIKILAKIDPTNPLIEKILGIEEND